MTSGSRQRSSELGYEARHALGGLLPLIDDPTIQDVLVQVSRVGSILGGRVEGGIGARVEAGVDPRIDHAGREMVDYASVGLLWVDRGRSLTPVEGWRVPPETVRQLAIALVAAGGRHLDELHPYADVHLGGGIRVHAILPPVAVEGAAVSIRLPSTAPLSFEQLIVGGLSDTRTAGLLRSAVVNRRNVLVTGGTATGKTTLLAALLDLVPHDQRIVTIEDVAELRITHPHHIALESRRPNAEGIGEVNLEQLLRESLRMRPDRIVLGECRGAELATMLSALNTGHDGGAATLHASTIDGVPARLEALGMLAGLDPPALARQAVSAIHLIVHLNRLASGTRQIAALGQPRLAGDRIELVAVP